MMSEASTHSVASQLGRFVAQWPVRRILVATGDSRTPDVANIKLLLRGKALLELVDGGGLRTEDLTTSTAVVELPGATARPLWRTPGAMLHIRCRPGNARLALVQRRPGGHAEAQTTRYCTLAAGTGALLGLSTAIAALAAEEGTETAQVHALRALCAAAHARLSTASSPHVSRSAELYDAIADHVRECCLEPITRERVATAFSISPSHLSRLFGRLGPESFSALLTHCRMQHARRLLLSTRLTVSEIACRCGYADVSHFIRVFRHDAGSSPGRFRATDTRPPANR